MDGWRDRGIDLRGRQVVHHDTGPIVIAVVGTGYGLRVAAPVYQRHPSFLLGAVVGRDVARTRSLLRSSHLPDDLALSFDELSASGDFDLIHVASPNVAHEVQVRQLVPNPASLLLEKPLSLVDQRQHELAELLLSRAGTTYVNFPLRALETLAPHALNGSNRFSATVRLESSFHTRYAGSAIWKTEQASGGGIYHMLLPHLCDYVVQLVRAANGRLTSLEVTLSCDEPMIGECLKVRVDNPSGRSITFSTADQVPRSEDTFAWLFRDIVDRLATTLLSHRMNRVGTETIGSAPSSIVGISDLLVAYRLCRFLEGRSSGWNADMSWHLDDAAIGLIDSWL